MSVTPQLHPHHPSQLDPREPPPPPASASDSDRHHHAHAGVIGLGIGLNSSGTGSGTTTPSSGLSPGRTRKTSQLGGFQSTLGHGNNNEPAISSPLQQEHLIGRQGSPVEVVEGNHTSSAARSFSPGSSPMHSRANSPAPPPALSAHNSSLLPPGSRRSSTPATVPEPVNHHRVRDDFIGVITPGSRTPVGSNSARGSFGANLSNAGNGNGTPGTISNLNVDSLKHEMKVLQDGMRGSDPLAGAGSGVSAVDEDDEYGVKEPMPMHIGSPGKTRSTSPVLDLLPRGSTLLPHSPSASSIHSNDLGARTLGEVGEEFLGPTASKHTGQMSPSASATGLDSSPLEKRASMSHIHAASMSMSMSTPNSPSASAIFERDIESPFAIALPGAQPSVANSPVPGGAGTALQRSASGRASRSSSAAPPRSPTPKRGNDAASRSVSSISPQAFINAAALPPYMHDSSDRHVPTVLDDAIEALTHSGSQALQIEAPVNAYIASREMGNRSPFGASNAMTLGNKAGGSRSPSPMRWKDLGRTGMDSTGRSGSRSASPLPSPTREKRSFLSTRPETEAGGRVFSLNDDGAPDAVDKTLATRPAMQARQSSLGVLIPGAFPGSSSQQEQDAGGRKWKKKIDEWIGPRPTALLAGSSDKQTERVQDSGKDVETGTDVAAEAEKTEVRSDARVFTRTPC